jgi:hypothetical protein
MVTKLGIERVFGDDLDSPAQKIFKVEEVGSVCIERFSLGCRAAVYMKRQPAKENSRLIPYICSGTALGERLAIVHEGRAARIPLQRCLDQLSIRHRGSMGDWHCTSPFLSVT